MDTLDDKRIYLNLAGLVESGFVGMELFILFPWDAQPENTIILYRANLLRVAVRHHTEETDG